MSFQTTFELIFFPQANKYFLKGKLVTMTEKMKDKWVKESRNSHCLLITGYLFKEILKMSNKGNIYSTFI